jgi:hypothetical protein
MAIDNRLKLSRDQLGLFLQNHEQIKQFEKLFAVVDEVSDNSDIQGTAIGAANAQASANEALAQIEALKQIIGLATEAENKAIQALDALDRLQNSISDISADLLTQYHNSIETDYIDLPEVGPHVSRERRIQWNRDDGTLDVGLYNGVVLQVGQETHYYAKNTSGASIPDGTPVMFTGTIGASGKLTFGLADASGAFPGEYLMGVTTQAIAKNAFGYVVYFGLARGINTTGTPYGEVWADGDLLYISPSTPGSWTKTMPTAPALHFPVAVVILAAVNGSIFARFKTGETLGNLSDVLSSAPAQNHIIQWDAVNSRWANTGLPKFGSATDYTGFEADGTMVATGLARTWVDIDFPIIIRTTGANIPTLATLKGNITVPQWQVNDFNVCEGQEMIHAWLEGSTIYWHVHVITNGLDATNRYLRFEVEWVFANIGGVLSATITDTSVDLLIPANTTDRTHLICSISNRLMTGNRIGTHVYARLRRVAAVGAAPTNDPFCSMLQLHVETDTTGSRQIATK